MDLASCCYKLTDGWDWISPGGVGYRAPFGAYDLSRERIKKSGIIGRVGNAPLGMHDDDDENENENYNENDDNDNWRCLL